ncbi:hypothetical protein DRP53_06145 [candidate division WOR-3 bacterium]|uniref:Mce/MlaD domain-containing protein n=1 Tax=candidate division WOR-3 bacterium TaxID=2052148 RepID=A0A660SIZ4_UNCW3|nr:MAG: hypothetical protein DRP53_06145 [candidate division WOR-3 bacterium]
MSRTKDALVGLFITIVILILLLGLNWIRSGEHFGSGTTYFATFADVEGLRPGARVSMRGIEIGQVEALELKPEFVLVRLRIDPKVTLTTGAKAKIRAFSYLGGERHIEIVPGDGSPLSSGDTIPGLASPSLEAMLERLEDLTKDLDFQPLKESFESLNRTIRRELKRGIDQLNTSFDDIDRITAQIDSILSDLRGKGTVGRLIHSDELYRELLKTNRELRGLIKDIKKNPDRYFTVKIF